MYLFWILELRLSKHHLKIKENLFQEPDFMNNLSLAIYEMIGDSGSTFGYLF